MGQRYAFFVNMSALNKAFAAICSGTSNRLIPTSTKSKSKESG